MSKDYENRILIIDGTYLAYKSYFATLYSGNGLMHTTSGVVTNEIVGFFNILIDQVIFLLHLMVLLKHFAMKVLMNIKQIEKKLHENFICNLM